MACGGICFANLTYKHVVGSRTMVEIAVSFLSFWHQHLKLILVKLLPTWKAATKRNSILKLINMENTRAENLQ